MVFKNIKALPRGLIFSALALFLILTAALYWLLHTQAREYRRDKIEEMQAALDYKTTQLQHWIKGQSANARLITGSPFLGRAVVKWQKNPGDKKLQAEIQSRLNNWREYFGYTDVMLVDHGGNILLKAAGTADVLGPETKVHLRQALAEGKYLLTDFYMCTIHHEPHIDVIAPLNSGTGGQAGLSTVILRVSPRDYLYPLMKDNAFPHKTFETLIVRQEGDSVLFLNDVRFAKDAALKLKIPLSRSNVTAVRAVLMGKTSGEGVDYRGQKVLTVTGPVAGSNWAVVAKMDIKEIFGPLWTRAYIWGLAALLVFIGSVSVLSLMFLNQRKDYYKRLYTVENERQALIKHYDYLTKYANDIIFLLDENRRVVEINERGVETYGYTREEFIGMDADRLRADDQKAPFKTQMSQLALQKGLLYETRHKRKDGSTFPVEISARTIEIEGKNYLQGIARDISERKLAEDVLRESEERFKRAVENIPDVMVIYDSKLKIKYINNATIQVTGRRPSDFIGKTEEEAWPPEVYQHYLPSLKESLNTGNICTVEAEIMLSPEITRSLVITCVPIKGGSGKVVEVLGITHDITERKRFEMVIQDRNEELEAANQELVASEEELKAADEELRQHMEELHRTKDALQDSETRYRSLFDNSMIGIYRTAPRGQILMANPALIRMLGFRSFEELAERNLEKEEDYYPEIPRKAFKEKIEAEGVISGWETIWKNSSGSSIYVRESSRAIKDSDGKILYYDGSVEDITERKQAENIMEARLRLIQFAPTHSLDELLQATLDELEILTGSRIGFYHFLEADQQTLSLQTWSTRTIQELCKAEGKGRHYNVSEAGIWVDCVRERRPVIHNDYASLPHRKGMPAGHAAVIRELVVPVMRGDKITAILGMGNKPENYTEADIVTVSKLADLAWDITERKRAEDQIKTQLSELQRWQGAMLDREDRVMDLKKEINELLVKHGQPKKYGAG